MIEFGNTLRQAREQKGLTTRQIAETTHMMVQLVEDLENERFSRIAAPIYGRGFVKLYCEAVGIDPKPLVAEFMEIFNGNREPTIRRRDEAPAAAPAPAPAPAPAAVPEPAPEPAAAPEPTPTYEDDGIISAATDPEPASVAAAEPPPQEDSLFAFARRPAEPAPRPQPAPAPTEPPAPADDPFARLTRGPSRYAAPAPIDDAPRGPRFTIPPAALRFLALAGGAALVLWLLYAGFSAIISALSSAPEAPNAETTPAANAATPSASAPAAAPRKPMDIPPLYID